MIRNLIVKSGLLLQKNQKFFVQERAWKLLALKSLSEWPNQNSRHNWTELEGIWSARLRDRMPFPQNRNSASLISKCFKRKFLGRLEMKNFVSARRFYDFAKMPNVCGCVDGTLIPILAPSVNEPQFVDRHGNHSINCMMVSGPDNYRFYYCSANWPEKSTNTGFLSFQSACSSGTG